MDLPDLPVSDVTPLGDRLHCVVVDYIPRGLCELALGEELWCGKVVWESGVERGGRSGCGVCVVKGGGGKRDAQGVKRMKGKREREEVMMRGQRRRERREGLRAKR